MIILKKLFAFLRSTGLAITLLISILIICFIGVVFLPVQVSREVIFSSIWFNFFLILLILNIIFCCFGRIFRRNMNVIIAGILIFHVSFVLIFAGIVYNSLFYFRGAIRLTEGESLSIAEPRSYDWAQWGPFFDHDRLHGELYFQKLYPFYTVEGKNKGVANEVYIRDSFETVRDFVYVTNPLIFNNFKYFRDKDGFSPLIILWDLNEREIYGAYVPLQSLKQKSETYLYTTGSAQGPGSIPFPQETLTPVISLQIIYNPPPTVEDEGTVFFRVWKSSNGQADEEQKLLFRGKAALGEKVQVGDYYLSMKEVRYWASMKVQHNPGLSLILGSFWIGLGGIVMSTIAKLMRLKKDKSTD